MNHYKHPLCNDKLKPPQNHDAAADGYACDTLNIMRGIDESQVPFVASFWKPSVEELAKLIEGGGVYVHIVGMTHPPIYIGVVSDVL